MEIGNIQGVPETMLQTLYARAAYSQQKNAKFHDPKAVEIVSRMDYDFSLAGKDAMMSTGVIARTILLDRMVGAFIRKNPGCTVVNYWKKVFTQLICSQKEMRCWRRKSKNSNIRKPIY